MQKRKTKQTTRKSNLDEICYTEKRSVKKTIVNSLREIRYTIHETRRCCTKKHSENSNSNDYVLKNRILTAEKKISIEK